MKFPTVRSPGSDIPHFLIIAFYRNIIASVVWYTHFVALQRLDKQIQTGIVELKHLSSTVSSDLPQDGKRENKVFAKYGNFICIHID